MNMENAELVGNIVSDFLHIAGVIMHLQRYRGEEDKRRECIETRDLNYV